MSPVLSQPSPVNASAVASGVPPIAGEDVRAAHLQFALVREPDLDERVRLAGVPELPHRVLWRQTEDVGRGLSQAVPLDHRRATRRPRLEQSLGHRRAADDGALEAGEVGVGERPILGEEEVDRRHTHHRRHALLLDQPEHPLGAELALEDERGALEPGEKRLHVPAADVKLRQHLEHDVSRMHAGREVEREVRPEAVRVREQRSLRLPRRS